MLYTAVFSGVCLAGYAAARLLQGSSTRLRPIVISGPSGSGKSTLTKLLMQDYPGVFGFSISHTTRTPRAGEKDGREYHFTTRESMLAAIKAGEFIESAEFSKNMYGTSKQSVQDVLDKNQICLLDIEKNGCESFRKTSFDAKFIQILPPSLDELEKRLRGRGSESDESLKLRMAQAVEALEYGKIPGKFNYTIVNHNKDVAYQELKAALKEDIELAQKLQRQ
eukprot:m.265727 g.265727  ORF g.265727 m.265727 type:complete len:223 (+) comp29484_c0_seq1:3-671(+)